MSALHAVQTRSRRVVYRTRGHSHGPITRLVSPSDTGRLLKPFVFLDFFDIDPKRSPAIGFHPHSGIATVTVVLDGEISYEETSGTTGIIEAGGVEWMRASGGVWHTGAAVGSGRTRGYQLWIALPPELENAEPEARYLGRERFLPRGPARVIIGRQADVTSDVPAPAGINYLDVSLKRAERWRYEPPADHKVAWVAVHRGRFAGSADVEAGELVVFEESNGALDFEAIEDVGFVVGSAVKHPYELVLGSYSVHTNRHALERGEARIAEIGEQLGKRGRV